MGTSALVGGNKLGGGEYPIYIVRQPYEGQNSGSGTEDRLIYM